MNTFLSVDNQHCLSSCPTGTLYAGSLCVVSCPALGLNLTSSDGASCVGTCGTDELLYYDVTNTVPNGTVCLTKTQCNADSKFRMLHACVDVCAG